MSGNFTWKISGIFLIFFLWAGIVTGQQACTLEDYEGTYTQCINNQRMAVWYLKPGVDCSGGEPLPSPIFNLPCDIYCGEGKYLPFGTTQCVDCGPGSYSVGGAYRITEWTNETIAVDPSSSFLFHFETMCEIYNQGALTRNRTMCNGWTATDDGSSIYSGVTRDSQQSELELSVYLVTDGHIHFEYRVSAEANFDGLIFSIDGEVVLPLTSSTPAFDTFKAPLSKGLHKFLWNYRKDFSYAVGDDAAFIRFIEVGGLQYAVQNCLDCPVGTYSLATGSEDCMVCDTNTYNNQTGQSKCEPCPDGYYSDQGETQCTMRQPCTSDDYYPVYSTCSFPGTRTKTYFWKQPMICNDVTGTPLPPPEYNLDCGPCGLGEFRDTDFQCKICPAGSASDGTTVCKQCSPGTGAFRGAYITSFTEWPANTSTTCYGVCAANDGWRLNGNNMDTGINYGSFRWVVFSWDVEFAYDGFLTFNYSVNCTDYCSLSFSTDNIFQYCDDAGIAKIDIPKGKHTLEWQFSTYATHHEGQIDAATIYEIRAYGVPLGGASDCIPCFPGSYAGPNAEYCELCPAGSISPVEHASQCETCKVNTFAEFNGSTECIDCGAGTTAPENSATCNTDCTFTSGDGITYDLNPLAVPEYYSAKNNFVTYYLNVCNRTTRCYNNNREPLNSFACYQPRIGSSRDIGRVIGFSSLDSDPAMGLIVNFTNGAKGCFKNATDPGIARSSAITITCNPTAGVGAPMVANPTESPNCHYNFVWESLYGCPLCSSQHYSFILSECRNNAQTKTYYWKTSPKQCWGGVALPEPEEIPCYAPTKECPAGEYLYNDECVACQPGTYSIGGGYEIVSWTKLPDGFATSCEGIGCTSWTPTTHFITAGTGRSILTLVGNFSSYGMIEFDFRAYTYAMTSAAFDFFVDGVNKYHLADTITFDYQTVQVELQPGTHTFKWLYESPSNPSVESGAFIRSVKVIGTSLAAQQCLPCPAGTYSNETRTTKCTECPIDTFSIGQATSCIRCDPGQYSLVGSNFCSTEAKCTAAAYQDFYTDCNPATNTSVHYLARLEPHMCTDDVNLMVNGVSLSKSETVNCTVVDRTCTKAGTYWSAGACVDATPGSYVTHYLSYWAGQSINKWPENFKTGCAGSCGSNGWRLRGNSIDSGFHNFDLDTPVDSYLSWTVDMESDGQVSFHYTLDGMNNAAILEFFIDMQPVPLYMQHPTYTLTKGTHTLIWSYHQPQGIPRDSVNITEILVTGSTQGIATKVMCPPGTYSNSSGATQCTPCSKGTATNVDESSICQSCDMNTYSAIEGGMMCIPCGAGTFTLSTGSNHCVTDSCGFTINGTNTHYALGQSERLSFTTASGDSIYLELCEPFPENSLCSSSSNGISYVCSVNDANEQTSYGSSLSFEPHENPSVGFTLKYSLGDANINCNGGSRTATINFLCAEQNFIRAPEVLSSDDCQISFLYITQAACPVCQDSDYNEVAGNCVDGQQEVLYIRKTLCNGPERTETRTVACDSASKIAFPVWGVIVTVVAVVVLLGVTLFYIVKHRKVQQSYEKLLSDKVELDEKNVIAD